MSADISTQRLAEYKELRAEIRHYLERRQTTHHFAYLLSLAVLGSDFITGNILPAPIFVLPPLLLMSLWADDIRRLKAIQRLGVYIRIVIEPHEKGLLYETLGLRPERKLSPTSRIIPNADFPLLYIALATLCAWKFWNWYAVGHLVAVLVTLFLLVLMVAIFHQGFIVARDGEKKEENRWLCALRNIQEKIKENDQ